MNPENISNLLFDLDGTLVDSRDTISASLDHALRRMGVNPQNRAPVDSMIGRSLLDIFQAEFTMSNEMAEQAIDHYRDHYDSLNQAGTRIYSNIQEVLASLRDTGYRMFVATVKPTQIAEKVLADMQLSVYFSGVAGSSMDNKRRDKSSIIAHALKKFDLEPGMSLMIGDRREDILGARRNGMAALAVSYGYGSLEELSSAIICHKPLDIIDNLRNGNFFPQ